MESTPKSMRLQIAIFGRTNVGKSSFLNMLANQDVAMTSPVPGTTTDVVEKSFELLPIGPVTFLDTAGIDDTSVLAEKRIDRTMKILNRADLIILLTEPNKWTEFEEQLSRQIDEHDIPYLIAVNKIDIEEPKIEFIELLNKKSDNVLYCSCKANGKQEEYINLVKSKIQKLIPADSSQSMPLVSDLVMPGGIAIFITPIDLQAPKGRLILPQVQAIRDILDNDAISIVVKEREYPYLLKKLNQKPDIVVCDSQVVMKMVADTPPEIKCTTFSILFSRYKGDLQEEVRGVKVIDKLVTGDKILIAEACSHHPLEDDIGRVKIPRWLRQYLGLDLQIDVCSGRDFPENLSEYTLIIHCGGCMLTRNEKMMRIQQAKKAGVPITNYGLTISLIQGVLERVLSPFPGAMLEFIKENN
ncbi:MAG: [FeFe] hydrogenase H-cluster maturation GTPase HydF [FCB group bacterium]|jgi:[FeFe] hydrogenase H-cluster maturation GTPase HydF